MGKLNEETNQICDKKQTVFLIKVKEVCAVFEVIYINFGFLTTSLLDICNRSLRKRLKKRLLSFGFKLLFLPPSSPSFFRLLLLPPLPPTPALEIFNEPFIRLSSMKCQSQLKFHQISNQQKIPKLVTFQKKDVTFPP